MLWDDLSNDWIKWFCSLLLIYFGLSVCPHILDSSILYLQDQYEDWLHLSLSVCRFCTSSAVAVFVLSISTSSLKLHIRSAYFWFVVNAIMAFVFANQPLAPFSLPVSKDWFFSHCSIKLCQFALKNVVQFLMSLSCFVYVLTSRFFVKMSAALSSVPWWIGTKSPRSWC